MDFHSKLSRLRLQKEIKNWDRKQPDGFKHHVSDDNLFRWIIDCIPPQGTLYSGESYKIQMDFPYNYPYDPPKVVFLDPVPVNPHVYSNGIICLEMLFPCMWSPGVTMATLCLSILTIFADATVKESPPDDDVYVNKISIGRTLQQTGWWFKWIDFPVKEIFDHPLDFHLCWNKSPAIKRLLEDKDWKY